MRYEQLLTLIALYKPKTIVEIGTNHGDRGLAMSAEALRHRKQVTYSGYDVFETKDEAFHEAAFNAKSFFAKSVVQARFDALKAKEVGFRYKLHKGMISETLHNKPVVADFVFIDGDHRCEAIRNDYESVKGSKVIVFDDYYTGDGDAMPDTRAIGCNAIVDDMKDAMILPAVDCFPPLNIQMVALIKKHVFSHRGAKWI